MKERIREIVLDNARLPVKRESVTDDSDLYISGMSSNATVDVMLALEQAFDVVFPDHLLQRSVFSSINNLHQALQEITQSQS